MSCVLMRFRDVRLRLGFLFCGDAWRVVCGVVHLGYVFRNWLFWYCVYGFMLEIEL